MKVDVVVRVGGDKDELGERVLTANDAPFTDGKARIITSVSRRDLDAAEDKDGNVRLMVVVS